MMHGHEQSDRSIVPKKAPNKARRDAAEELEGRVRTEGNLEPQTTGRTQRRGTVPNAWDRIHLAASRDREQKFTALLHHIYSEETLRQAFEALNRHACPGVDGVTWEAYRTHLRSNLKDLSERLKRGAYRAKPVQRTHIPKPDGGKRPLGMPILEDKIVQSAASHILSAIYEADFCGFSYGFRQERGAHDALDALTVGLMKKKVNYVLDADIRGYFDAIVHERLLELLEHRIADRRVLRLIKKWLNAGVRVADGTVVQPETGTPQGGSISPLLANIYLHYVLDHWTAVWREFHAQGDVIITRYADDFIVGFQHKAEAERFLAELQSRFKEYGLELHPDKTRLIEFGRFAAERRQRRGEGKPETFEFLGFTHICGHSKRGGFIVKRRTIARRLQRALKRVKEQLDRRMHDPVPEVGEWLRRVIVGWFNYHAVPFNRSALVAYYLALARHWKHVLGRRSDKGYVTWERMERLLIAYFPRIAIKHPAPWERLRC